MPRIIPDYLRMIIHYYVPSQPGFFVLARTIRVPSAYFVCNTLYAELELCMQLCMQENPVRYRYQYLGNRVLVPGTLVAGTEGVESGPDFERVLTYHGAQRASRGTSTH